MFQRIYQKILAIARHKHATGSLCVIGFLESIIVPLPADIFLLPMCIARPERGYFYATLLTIVSILGGVIGYALGFFFADTMLQFIHSIGQDAAFLKFQNFFNDYGVALVFVAGFTPFPYKVAAIGAGLLQIYFPFFLLGSILSRPIRFFLIAFAVKKGGVKLQKVIFKYIEYIGWAILLLLAFVGLFLYITG